MGKAHTAGWLAIGFRQDIDTVPDKGWQSVTYLGMGRISQPDDYDPYRKPSIFVINQEFYHQLPKNWQHSIALSYRRQHEYQDEFPFAHEHPEIRHELRAYSRLFYTLKSSRIKFTPAFRQEFRKYFSSATDKPAENFQLRSRFKLQLSVYLDKQKRHRLTAGSEQLFSVSKEENPDRWTAFEYKESRFSLYYSFAPEKLPLIFSTGYMYNIVGTKSSYDVHYFAFDIVIENPFKKFR